MADRLRWPVAGAPADALFDVEALAGHHVGGGEWAGYEFLEVNAKTLINTLPASSHMPFRHTVNVYRGCSHACSYCLAGDTRVLMADGRSKALSDVRAGDAVLGTKVAGHHRRYVTTTVTDHWTTVKPAYRVTLADGTSLIASGDHRFLTRRGWKHVTDGTCGAGRRPHLTSHDLMVGPGGGPVEFADADGDEASSLDRATAAFTAQGLDTRREGPNAAGVSTIPPPGGLPERLRSFGLTRPAITRQLNFAGVAVNGPADLRVVAIEPATSGMELHDITTGTGDFIANGVISHNCFARPTHEYLGLDIGDDFERRIVVKVNAVERLRAELAASRWAGDHIAMGTNTDPYQRCEGKYRLTRGVVEALVERENPFSILTKSTLVLRDLDLMVEAAKRCDARVNLSIGTLDESVWRLTEPGTPSPRLRVEAVRRLNEAGVPCGVLIAPVLPGLSDAPAHLKEVVDAVVGAGATSVSTVMLYLRPGVRELYLERLRARDPSLAASLDARYVRTHLPKAEEQALSEKVRELVAAARRRLGRPAGTYVEGGFAERVRAQTGAALPPPPPTPSGEQLGLDL